MSATDFDYKGDISSILDNLADSSTLPPIDFRTCGQVFKMEPTDTLSSYSGGFFTPDLSPSNETVPLDLGNFRDFNKNRLGNTYVNIPKGSLKA
jgi:hypothetical protein